MYKNIFTTASNTWRFLKTKYLNVLLCSLTAVITLLSIQETKGMEEEEIQIDLPTRITTLSNDYSLQNDGHNSNYGGTYGTANNNIEDSMDGSQQIVHRNICCCVISNRTRKVTAMLSDTLALLGVIGFTGTQIYKYAYEYDPPNVGAAIGFTSLGLVLGVAAGLGLYWEYHYDYDEEDRLALMGQRGL